MTKVSCCSRGEPPPFRFTADIFFDAKFRSQMDYILFAQAPITPSQRFYWWGVLYSAMETFIFLTGCHLLPHKNGHGRYPYLFYCACSLRNGLLRMGEDHHLKNALTRQRFEAIYWAMVTELSPPRGRSAPR